MRSGRAQNAGVRQRVAKAGSSVVAGPRDDGRASPAREAGPGPDNRREPASSAIELRALTVRYKSLTALNAVDLKIREGEFFSLLGPSGCGKTTTLNIIGGFVKPDEGEVLIQGRTVNHLPPYRRPVNTVFQSYALFPHMTVAENVGFGPRMAGIPAAQVKTLATDALALVSLVDFGGRRPDQLSGGQQQRVALARALVNHPSVLLLDEPLGALDLKLRKQMQLELSRIQREVGITFVYVTHDQDEAMTMSDRIAVMNRGAIVQVGSPQEIYERPASLFVADFIGTSNLLRGRVRGRRADWAVVELEAGEEILVPRVVHADAQQRVSVIIRPDHMTLTNAPPATPETNAVRGRVSRVSYLGTHLHITVETVRHGNLTVMEPMSADRRGSVGLDFSRDVHVTWPAARSLCFAEEARERAGVEDNDRD